MASDFGAPFCLLADGREDGAVSGTVFGTYLHGLFDSGELTGRLAAWLLGRKGLAMEAEAGVESRRDYRERQYDLLADAVRSSLDMGAVYAAMDRRAEKEKP